MVRHRYFEIEKKIKKEFGEDCPFYIDDTRRRGYGDWWYIVRDKRKTQWKDHVSSHKTEEKAMEKIRKLMMMEKKTHYKVLYYPYTICGLPIRSEDGRQLRQFTRMATEVDCKNCQKAIKNAWEKGWNYGEWASKNKQKGGSDG